MQQGFDLTASERGVIETLRMPFDYIRQREQYLTEAGAQFAGEKQVVSGGRREGEGSG